MTGDLQKLGVFIETQKDNVAGPTFSMYHKWDVVKEEVTYTSGIPVIKIPAEIPEGFITDSIPESKTFTLEHTGPYRHLGNAWSTLFTMHRNKEFIPVKGYHPFEEYINQPGEVPEQELITRIHFGVK